MKKKLLFCLAVLGTASMLFGFDSAETVDSLMEKMGTAAKESTSLGADIDMDMNVDLSVDIDDGTTSSSIGIGASGDFDMEVNKEPAAMSMEGSLNMSLLGQSQTMTLKLYGISSEDGTVDTYMYSEESASGEEGTWEHQSSEMSDFNMDELMEKISGADFSEWGVDFELASEPATVDGTECYLVSAELDSVSFETMLNKLAEKTGEDIESNEDVQMLMSMMNGVRVNIEYYVDTATYYPVKFHMDMNGSDLSALSQYFAMSMGEMAEGSSVEIVLNDVSLDFSLAYGDAKEITVPAEALAASDSSADSVIGEVEDALGALGE